MKRTIFSSVIVILLVILGSGIFYWFQIRPSEIRKECSKETKIRVQQEEDAPGEPNYTSKQVNNWYRICLIEHGLAGESLLVNVE